MEENVALVREAFAAYSAGGIEALLPLLAPNVVCYAFVEWLEDPVYRGHDGARRLDAVWSDNFDDFSVDLCEIRDVPDHVVALTEMTGRSRDSGVSISQSIGFVYSDFRDGKVGAWRAFTSWPEALKAVGLEQ